MLGHPRTSHCHAAHSSACWSPTSPVQTLRPQQQMLCQERGDCETSIGSLKISQEVNVQLVQVPVLLFKNHNIFCRADIPMFFRGPAAKRLFLLCGLRCGSLGTLLGLGRTFKARMFSQAGPFQPLRRGFWRHLEAVLRDRRFVLQWWITIYTDKHKHIESEHACMLYKKKIFGWNSASLLPPFWGTDHWKGSIESYHFPRCFSFPNIPRLWFLWMQSSSFMPRTMRWRQSTIPFQQMLTTSPWLKWS